MSFNVYPMKFDDIYKDRIWGGRGLEEVLGKSLPEGDTVIGESWEVADHRSETSVVSNGVYQGRTLRSLREEFGQDIVGRRGLELGRGRLPLLIKFLDARDFLSVQVHPDDAYAAEREDGELGKTEMWYVVHADPGAKLVLGLQPGTTRESLRHAIAEGRVEDFLREVEVRAGECYFTPAGRVHAIGAGNIICEVQQNSDVTYRFYDWNRLDAGGQPRELHIEKSLDVINFKDHDPSPVVPRVTPVTGGVIETLVTCRQFVAEKLSVRGAMPVDTGRASFHVVTVLDGEGEIRAGSMTVPIRKGESALVPCAAGRYEITAADGLLLLRSSVALMDAS